MRITICDEANCMHASCNAAPEKFNAKSFLNYSAIAQAKMALFQPLHIDGLLLLCTRFKLKDAPLYTSVSNRLAQLGQQMPVGSTVKIAPNAGAPV
jgi:hypothetical protein